MRHLSRVIVPPPWKKGESERRQKLGRLFDIDIALRLKMKEIERRLPLWYTIRTWGGSGLSMDVTLRSFFREYFGRMYHHGFWAFPSSFNVLEAFVVFEREFSMFDLRPQHEHLLSLDDYFAWYNRNDMPKAPSIMVDGMQEGIIHSYNFTADTTTYRLHSGDATFAIAGVSLIRFQNELVCMLLAGESPPRPPDSEIKHYDAEGKPTRGKEALEPAPELSVKSRYLDGFPNCVRIIAATRIDLMASKFDVRYLFVDYGQYYKSNSDDPIEYGTVPDEDAKRLAHGWQSVADDYGELFSVALSLIYLPLMLASESTRISETSFATELAANKNDEFVVGAVQEFGAENCPFTRSVKCLSRNVEGRSSTTTIFPPNIQFTDEGSWKMLRPGEIGEDPDGNPIVGRTWLQRKEMWAIRKPSEFLLAAFPETNGPDPGEIYVLRSPAHGADLYKIGLTRRSNQKRASELSATTGVPLRFDVLASWDVDDCGTVEAEIHKRLEWCRINPRREFFATSLANIVTTVQQVIAEVGKG
jgi:hypothetical protein